MQSMFSFHGRASRKSFWLAQIGVLAPWAVVCGYSVAVGYAADHGLGGPSIFYSDNFVLCGYLSAFVLSTWCWYATAVRRMRDLGVNTGWALAHFATFLLALLQPGIEGWSLDVLQVLVLTIAVVGATLGIAPAKPERRQSLRC